MGEKVSAPVMVWKLFLSNIIRIKTAVIPDIDRVSIPLIHRVGLAHCHLDGNPQYLEVQTSWLVFA